MLVMNLSLEKLLWLFFPFIFAFYFIWYAYYRKSNILKFCKHQNGPRAFPLIGNLNLLYNKNVFQCLDELKKKYSMPFNVWLWDHYYYVTDNPQEIKALLCNSSKSFSKAPFYDDLFKVIMGDSLIMTPVSKIQTWKLERNLIAKAFSPSMTPYYASTFHKKAQKVIAALNNISNFNNLHSVLTKIVFEIFMESFMDIKTEHDIRYGKIELALTKLIDMLSNRSILSRLAPHLFWKSFTIEGRTFDSLLKYIRYTIKQGNETSVLALSYTLVFLGMHPEIQKKVYQEVLTHVGYKEVMAEDVSKLTYMEQTILEAMRILPIIPITGRHVTGDINLGNKVLPKGANAAIIPYLVHKNEKYWHNPEKFNPDRFSPENIKNIVAGSYVPFSMGARECIGKYYVVAMVKIFTANILRNYKISVDPKIADDFKIKSFIVIKPASDFNIKFERRTVKDNKLPMTSYI